MADKEALQRAHAELADSGKLIEAGWVSLRIACDLHDAPKEQLEEMRNAFFAGAQHLFGSIVQFLDEGDEPTDNDFRRLNLIADELDTFIADFRLRHLPTEGEA